MTILDKTPFISQCISASKAWRGDYAGATRVQMEFLGLEGRDPNDVFIISQFISLSKAGRGEYEDATQVQKVFLERFAREGIRDVARTTTLVLAMAGQPIPAVVVEAVHRFA